jgi:hypothetical protein
MIAIKERGWITKFSELPLLLKIVVVWVYLISIGSFIEVFFALIVQLRLHPFTLAFGYLIWVLAGGLVDRSNIARLIALVCFGFSAAINFYILWNGGMVSIDGLKLSASYPGSIIWIVESCGSILILLLPQVRRLFVNSIQEEITQ